MLRKFSHIGTAFRRRRALRARFDIAKSFAELEESCVPFYSHSNPLAAMVAWQRLLAVAHIYERFPTTKPFLDFGAGTGEASHFIGTGNSYHFIEEDDFIAAKLKEFVPTARRQTLETLPAKTYGCVLALDSLEHNDDVPGLVDHLSSSLAPDGVMIVSGPTESALYRLGRAIAGFSGHCHKTTVYDIEQCIGERMERLAVCRVPFGVPLFRITAWRHR